MINKNYELMAIPGSVKQFNEGILARNNKTGQFGTVHPASLKGKQARRRLLEGFKPIQFAVVDNEPANTGDLVVVTLKDGDRILAKCGDILEDMVMKVNNIVIPPNKIMETKVGMSRSEGTTEFRYLSPFTVRDILSSGGRIALSNLDNGENLIVLDLPKITNNANVKQKSHALLKKSGS